MLTKQNESIENILRCQVSVEDATHGIDLRISNLGNANSNILRGHGVLLDEEPKITVPGVVKKTRVRRSKLGKVTEKLYNLESDIEQEKPVKIELNLYQMEDY